jgi:hypothetical protein
VIYTCKQHVTEEAGAMIRIEEFFAVTMTAIYHVQSKKPEYGIARCIASVDSSNEVAVGQVLEGGDMVAICDCLTVYFPTGQDDGSERKIQEVSTKYWGESSSNIVALFATKGEAMTCLGSCGLELCDPRWAEKTLSIVNAIGNDHPVFEVCRNPILILPLLKGSLSLQ